jgi:serine protease AprX
MNIRPRFPSPLKRLIAGASAGLALMLASLPGAMSAAAITPAAPASPYISAALQRHMQVEPTRRLPVILQLKSTPTPRASSQAAQTALGLLRQHGKGGTALGMIRAASGALDAAAIQAIARDPRVAAIYEDVPVRRQDQAPSTTALSTAYPFEVNATGVWQQNATGNGVTVAVLDSGITPDVDLTQPSNRILTAVNFADPLTASDPGGHGTHVAGIIAGNGTRSDGQFMGVAPGANLVDVRVLDSLGNGSASSVIAGLQWTVAHALQYRIQVVNLSLGATPSTDYQHDPLAAAVELAWLRGLVVVTAAGNGGANAINTPGIDPFVITVGAIDDQTTPGLSDDTLPVWTSWGTPIGGSAKPDLVAPGRRIISIRAPGSTLDQLLPNRVVAANNGSTYFSLSGTSMAAGVVSGVAALFVETHAALSPSQVKGALTGTAQVFGQATGLAVPSPSTGSGLVNALAATTARVDRGQRVADPAAQALYTLLYGQPLVWKDPNYAGVDWASQTWATLAWNDLAWDNLAWDSFAWSDLAWDTLNWTDLAWDSVSWTDLAWDTSTPTVPDPN